MRLHKLIGSIAMAALVGCSSDNNTTTPDAPPPTPDAKVTPDAGPVGFTQPTGTIAVNFTVDDTTNKAFTATQADGASDLWWKGSVSYDPATRLGVYDATAWAGTAAANNWARLYDDGPWAQGGHEPAGATKGDHKWGITVFVAPPATGMQIFDYGLTDGDYEVAFGNGWMWPSGPNGMFTVNAGATAAITAPGLTIPAYGTVDLQIVIDTNNLDTTVAAWDTSAVGLKGSMISWGVQSVTKGGDGKATFTLSGYVGAGKPLPHTGLLHSGDTPQFVVVFGTPPVEYKDAGGFSFHGVTAGTKASAASTFTPATITLATTGDPNPTITVP